MYSMVSTLSIPLLIETITFSNEKILKFGNGPDLLNIFKLVIIDTGFSVLKEHNVAWSASFATTVTSSKKSSRRFFRLSIVVDADISNVWSYSIILNLPFDKPSLIDLLE